MTGAIECIKSLGHILMQNLMKINSTIANAVV